MHEHISSVIFVHLVKTCALVNRRIARSAHY